MSFYNNEKNREIKQNNKRKQCRDYISEQKKYLVEMESYKKSNQMNKVNEGNNRKNKIGTSSLSIYENDVEFYPIKKKAKKPRWTDEMRNDVRQRKIYKTEISEQEPVMKKKTNNVNLVDKLATHLAQKDAFVDVLFSTLSNYGATELQAMKTLWDSMNNTTLELMCDLEGQ